MVEEANKLGFKSLGFSAHGCVDFYSHYSLTKEVTKRKMTFWFDEAIELLRYCGFKEIQYFDGKEFIPQKI